MKYGIIYLHKNKLDGKCYIGSTVQKNPERRWRRTNTRYTSYKNCAVFYKALLKYSWNNFDTSILESNIPLDKISEREEFYIRQYNSLAPNGYNIVNIIEGRIECSQKTKDKISKRQKEHHAKLEFPIIAVNRKFHAIKDGIEYKQCTGQFLADVSRVLVMVVCLSFLRLNLQFIH